MMGRTTTEQVVVSLGSSHPRLFSDVEKLEGENSDV